jgi:enediyne biosynthesis protein E4
VFLVGIDTPNRLYRNDGGFKFTDVTADSGTGLDGGDARGSAAVFADLDNDLDLDLYVCNKLEANQLYINDGKGKFTEEAEKRGAASKLTSVQAAVFDADLDGDLDMYVCNHRGNADDPRVLASLQPQPGKEAKIPPEQERFFYVDDWGRVRMKPDPDEFLQNDGKGHFTDRSGSAGMVANSWSLQAQASDFTGDGWPDLYVSSDFETPDIYYANNGDGTFTDRSRDMLRKTPLFGMGCDSGDLNLDGESDLFLPDMLARDYKRAKRQSGDMWQWRYEMLYQQPQPQMRNMLQINRGGGWFSEVAQMCGVEATDWTWAARIADLNSDGIPELFTTTGMSRDAMDVDATMRQAKMMADGVPIQNISQQMLSEPVYKVQNYLFSATEPLKYKLVEDSWGMPDETFSAGASMADFDGDGDRDLIIVNTRDNAMIWRNDIEQGNRVVIDLRQEGPNFEAVGAKVTAHCGDDIFMQEMIIARGYATGEPCRAYLGIGKHETIDNLDIRWPDRMVQTETNLQAGMHYTIFRKKAVTAFEPPAIETLFAQSEIAWEQKELDTQAVEFEKEPLLPIQQTQLGTGAGVCDYDKDGNQDVYLAGAAGQVGQLFKGNGDGTFAAVAEFKGALPAESEEMAVLWFDANGDGHADLLVTSGGEEATLGSDLYQPKLYLNSVGKLTEKSLPTWRGSNAAACAADVDGDGDLDLLVCGHIPSYRYAASVPSVFWLNDGEGNFSDQTGVVMPGLSAGRQITDAQFTDMDGDGTPELLVARFFGGVEVWSNSGGKFALTSTLTKNGWWRGLGVGDFDGDADIDIICANLGNSTKYHPKEGAPVTLFANDFDGNGTRDLVEVKYRKDGMMLPGRGRSCSGYAIGYIPQKWPTWESFANASLEDVYGTGLEKAERFDAEEVRSLLLVNDGSGAFAQQELPGTAQWAPAFGVAVGDFNTDGNLDACLANNFTYPQPEAGRWSTGYGVVLIGDGTGGFKDLGPRDSGVSAWRDSRSCIPADFNNDGSLDLLISVSNGHPMLELNKQMPASGSVLQVRLHGKGKNPDAVGATVVAVLQSGKRLVRVVQAGSGYLGSYTGLLHFGLPAGDAAKTIEVTWPGGDKQTAEATGAVVDITQQ